jgi:hypothetical protein
LGIKAQNLSLQFLASYYGQIGEVLPHKSWLNWRSFASQVAVPYFLAGHWSAGWRFIEAEILAHPRTLYRALLIERSSCRKLRSNSI